MYFELLVFLDILFGIGWIYFYINKSKIDRRIEERKIPSCSSEEKLQRVGELNYYESKHRDLCIKLECICALLCIGLSAFLMN